MAKEKLMAGPNRVVWFVGLVIGTAGIVLVSSCVWIFVDNWWFSATAKRAEGVVTRIESDKPHANRKADMIYTFVEFQDGGRLVEFRSQREAVSPIHFEVGEKVPILYQPGKGEQARIQNFFEQYFLAILFGLMGAAFLVVSGTALIIPGREWHRRQLILTAGVSVQAEVIEIRIDRSIRSGQNSWMIVAEYQDEKLPRKLTFTSDYLWSDPTSHYPVGSAVTVFYLRTKPTIHAFVLDRIPEAS
jgi:hypothetical protein